MTQSPRDQAIRAGLETLPPCSEDYSDDECQVAIRVALTTYHSLIAPVLQASPTKEGR